MSDNSEIRLADEILGEWKSVIGSDYDGYRNHVQRMIQFCLALRECSEEEKQEIVIAGVFHDLGIWIEDTFDYIAIAPSFSPAVAYLEEKGLEECSPVLELMISEHHKLRAYEGPGDPLAELFRRGGPR